MGLSDGHIIDNARQWIGRENMRVIAGSKRRLQLKTVPGMGTRPTTDRIKETLFNMIADEIYGKVFLDMFAGSGQIGIEALSRGASHAYFIEKDRNAIACIEDNLRSTNLMDIASIIKGDYAQTLQRIPASAKVDVVFMDPPYNNEIEHDVLQRLMESEVLAENALIIIEASLTTDFSYITELGYKLLKEKRYKTNKHVFVERK